MVLRLEVKPLVLRALKNPFHRFVVCLTFARSLSHYRFMAKTVEFPIHEVDGVLVKRCRDCLEIKPISFFGKKRLRGGQSYCKKCLCVRAKNTVLNHTPEQALARLENQRRWNDNNRQHLNARQAAYARRDYVRERRRNHKKARRIYDEKYRIAENMRTRIKRALSRFSKKASSTCELVGCSVEQLMSHLTRDGVVISPEMVIDHVMPCCMFDFDQASHQFACFNYKNLRLCHWTDNADKSDLLDDGRRARFLTPEQKKEYLISHGYAYLFQIPHASSQGLSLSVDAS